MNKTFTKLKSRLLAAAAIAILSAMPALAQNSFVPGPAANGTSGSNRGPSGAADFQRTATIYRASEFPGFPAGTNVTAVGFSINQPAAAVATGTIKIYMANTTDANYSRGTSWATILSTPTAMTLVYDGPLTIPNTAGFFNVALQTPFAYTGGNFYFAYEWSATTKSATSAIYDANTPSGNLVTVAAATLAGTATLSGSSTFRPVLNLGFPTPANDLSVMAVFSQGKLALASGTPHVVKALIRNTGASAATNKTVTLTVTGTNTVTSTATIASLAPNAETVVSFPAYTATTTGSNAIEVSVPNDDFNGNNAKDFDQIISANSESYAVYPNATSDPDIETATPGPVGNTAATNSGVRLAKFFATNRVKVTGLRTVITGPAFNSAVNTIGRTVFAIVVDGQGNVLARSADKVLAAADVDDFIDFTFTTPAIVENADYYIGLGMLADAAQTDFSYPFTAQNEDAERPGAFYAMPVPGTTPTAPVDAELDYRLLFEAQLTNITGVKEDLNAKLVSVYPNPSNGVFNVSAKELKGSNLNLEVRDMQGRLVYSAAGNKDNTTINLKNVASGVYMLKVATDSEVAVKRLVVK